jgi:ATP phosphoribosyltransferase regulatory subunit
VVERGLSPVALAQVLKFVEPGSGEVVAIRPDITPQIVRLYAARPDALPDPARLCYDGPVLRAREARAGRPREVYQAGVELLGAGGAAADAEALAVLRKALDRVGLDDAVLEVGHARFAGAVIEAAGLRAGARAEAEEALSRKDQATLSRLAGKARGTLVARKVLPSLAGLYGEGALSRARSVAKGVPGAAAPLSELEAALRIARRRGVRDVEVDLGEVRGLGYYTGITFAGYAPGAGSAVASGGRYDGLLARFGRPGPAIGFAVDLEYATQALERRGSRRTRR